MTSIIVSAPLVQLPECVPVEPAPTTETNRILNEMLQVQMQVLDHLQRPEEQPEEPNYTSYLIEKHRPEFNTLPEATRMVLPNLEQAYLRLMQEVVERLQDEDSQPLENEFALGELLDRYGVRLAQLSQLLGTLGQAARTTVHPV